MYLFTSAISSSLRSSTLRKDEEAVKPEGWRTDTGVDPTSFNASSTAALPLSMTPTCWSTSSTGTFNALEENNQSDIEECFKAIKSLTEVANVLALSSEMAVL